jgi:putative YphP/YqiW family bacilliredoxin
MVRSEEAPVPYPEEMVMPMRAEATSAGATELRTAEDVKTSMQQRAGTALYFINSVCGCSASSARPGLGMSLKGAKRPDRVYTSFAGNDTAAVAEIRSHMTGVPPSSPSMALFKDGHLVAVLERHNIQGTTAEQLAGRLAGIYAEYC